MQGLGSNETWARGTATGSKGSVEANGQRMAVDRVGLLRVILKQLTTDHGFVVCPEFSCALILGHDFFQQHKCVPDCERKALHVRKQAIPFIRKLGQSSSDSLKFEYLPMMHSVAPLSEFESMNGQDSKLYVTHIHKLPELVIASRDVFTWEGQAIERFNDTQHEIHTEDSGPICNPSGGVPVHYEQKLQELNMEMLENNVIKPHTSPWSSPIMLVKKKNGSLRLCVDYWKLNTITKLDSFPFPRAETT